MASVAFASNALAGGSCAPDGDTTSTCHWEIENGVLTISGSGAMVGYSSQSMYPWYSQKDSYTSVVVEGANETTGTTGITSIGEYAFSNNDLTSVVIPDSVTSIGRSAFNNNNNLTSVVISDSVTSIGEYTFYNNNLTSVVIPDSVTSIGVGAFYKNNLTSVVIPDSVTSIGNNAFKGSQATDLVCSAENLQRYLDAFGALVNSGDINLSCTTGDCKAVLEAWDTAKGTNYASRAKTIITKTDGSKAIYDLSGKFLGYKNKRIYTIEEANRVAGERNTIRIRYK